MPERKRFFSIEVFPYSASTAALWTHAYKGACADAPWVSSSLRHLRQVGCPLYISHLYFLSFFLVVTSSRTQRNYHIFPSPTTLGADFVHSELGDRLIPQQI